MSADVAMTKRGFGEMAITATLAGPIFNILFGTGLSALKTILSKDPLNNYLQFSTIKEDGSFDKSAMIAIVLIFTQMVVMIIGLINALVNNF